MKQSLDFSSLGYGTALAESLVQIFFIILKSCLRPCIYVKAQNYAVNHAERDSFWHVLIDFLQTTLYSIIRLSYLTHFTDIFIDLAVIFFFLQQCLDEISESGGFRAKIKLQPGQFTYSSEVPFFKASSNYELSDRYGEVFDLIKTHFKSCIDAIFFRFTKQTHTISAIFFTVFLHLGELCTPIILALTEVCPWNLTPLLSTFFKVHE